MCREPESRRAAGLYVLAVPTAAVGKRVRYRKGVHGRDSYAGEAAMPAKAQRAEHLPAHRRDEDGLPAGEEPAHRDERPEVDADEKAQVEALSEGGPLDYV